VDYRPQALHYIYH